MERIRQQQFDSDSPLVADPFPGVVDFEFRDFLGFVSQQMVREDQFDGLIDYSATIRNIYTYFDATEVTDALKFQRMTGFIQDIKSARMVNLKAVGARQTRKLLADEDTIYFVSSYVFARRNKKAAKEDRLSAVNILNDAQQLWGENYMSGYISRLMEENSEILEEVAGRTSRRKPAGTGGNKSTEGHHLDPDEVTNMILEQSDIEQIQRWLSLVRSTVNIAFQEKDGFIDWHHSFIPLSVGRVIDYIRKANAHSMEENKGDFRMTLEELQQGLVVVRGYLQKYRGIPNLKVLYDLVKVKIEEEKDKNKEGDKAASVSEEE